MTKGEWHMQNADAVIRIVAMVEDENGLLSVADIVETCRYHAYRFISRFIRDDEIVRIEVMRRDAPETKRTIYRGRNGQLECMPLHTTTYSTKKTVTLTVAQWLSVKIAMVESARWNDEHNYPQSAQDIRALNVLINEQVDAAIEIAAARLEQQMKEDRL